MNKARTITTDTRIAYKVLQMTLRERGLEDLAIVEFHPASSDQLIPFVPTTGDDDHVATARAGRRTLDRGAPIQLDVRQPDVRRDRRRILVSRIVAGDDHGIGQLRSDASHERSFAHIAIAATSEHTKKACRRMLMPHGGQRRA